MRSLLLLLIAAGSIPVILVQPFVGLLMYSWLAYMRPHDMVWEAIPQLSLFVALGTLVGLVVATGREKWMSMRLQTVLLIAFGVWVGLSTVMALDPWLAMGWMSRLAKILLISVITTGLVRDEKRFRMLYLVIAFSLGALGAKYALYGILRGGAKIMEGPGGFMTDNNAFALALNMGIPLLVGVALVEDRRWIRAVAWVCAGCSAIAVVFTYSRGGLLTLVVVAVVIMARSGRPLLIALIVAIAVSGFLVVVSSDFEQSYAARAGSIKDYDQDESLMGRVYEWGTALRIFKDYPVFGVGPDNLGIARPFYVTDGSPYRVQHNAFLQLLVACGLPGMLLFVAALGVSYYRLRVIRRTTTHPWARTYAAMLQGSLAAYVVGGMLLDMAYFDLVYQLIAITVSLELAALSSDGVTSRVLRPTVSAVDGEWWRTTPADSRTES